MENRATELVLELYRGVTAEECWVRALDLISDEFRGSALFFGKLGHDGSSTMVGHRIDASCAALVGGPLATAAANPFIVPMMSKSIGKAYPTAVMCGDRAFVSSPLFDGAMRPHGQRFTIGAMLERIGRSARTIALTRAAGEGDYTEQEARSLDVFLPHLARALHLRDTFEQVEAEAAAAFGALDAVARGIVILSSDLRIAFANAEARRIFALDDGIGATGTGLCLADRRAADQLRRQLKSLLTEHPLAPRAMPAPICVSRPSGRLPFALALMGTPELLHGTAARGSPQITVTITDPERKSTPAISHLRQIYSLTGMEAKLAAALCYGDLREAAAELGISINTAKTHLQAVFHKVGVSRQSALVRLITLVGGD
jgi:DNA-binding CsgD family transcriptional regulator/PAS domain-containing protein